MYFQVKPTTDTHDLIRFLLRCIILILIILLNIITTRCLDSHCTCAWMCFQFTLCHYSSYSCSGVWKYFEVGFTSGTRAIIRFLIRRILILLMLRLLILFLMIIIRLLLYLIILVLECTFFKTNSWYSWSASFSHSLYSSYSHYFSHSSSSSSYSYCGAWVYFQV